MINKKVDFKLINTALIALIVFLLYQTGSLWIGVVSKIFSILFPFIVAFAVAYALYPFLQFLMKKKIPKTISIFIILAIVLGIISFIGFVIFPMIFNQLPSLFNGIIDFVKTVASDYNLNTSTLQNTLSSSFNDIIINLSSYVSNGAINIIGASLGYLSTALISFSAAIYFLADMDKIRAYTKKYLKKKSNKAFKYISLLDHEMKSYLSGFLRIILITLVEYTCVYTLIGHPQALLLGFLAMIANLIPYFGGMITNGVAAVTAFVISPSLFVKTIISFVILSGVDGYVINPFVYGKTNKLHPLIVIMSVFVGGALLGILGIFIAIPLAIFTITTIKYFKEDMIDKIEDIKEKNK